MLPVLVIGAERARRLPGLAALSLVPGRLVFSPGVLKSNGIDVETNARCADVGQFEMGRDDARPGRDACQVDADQTGGDVVGAQAQQRLGPVIGRRRPTDDIGVFDARVAGAAVQLQPLILCDARARDWVAGAHTGDEVVRDPRDGGVGEALGGPVPGTGSKDGGAAAPGIEAGFGVVEGHGGAQAAGRRTQAQDAQIAGRSAVVVGDGAARDHRKRDAVHLFGPGCLHIGAEDIAIAQPRPLPEPTQVGVGGAIDRVAAFTGQLVGIGAQEAGFVIANR